jgi:thiol-disulfide isomerase/thioredoxin
MRFILIALILSSPVVAYSQNTNHVDSLFVDPVLHEYFATTNEDSVNWKSIVDRGKGYVQVIDIWATWCRDCIVGFPALKKLQKDFKKEQVKFVFLSLDKTVPRWKWGILNYQLEGDHYFINRGWKGPFCSALKLDWVPRYLVIDQNGQVALFRSIKSDDGVISDTIKKLLKNTTP